MVGGYLFLPFPNVGRYFHYRYLPDCYAGSGDFAVNYTYITAEIEEKGIKRF